jgi:acyl-CoA synthetase (AMP-forming)/AMP-acid ligase II
VVDLSAGAVGGRCEALGRWAQRPGEFASNGRAAVATRNYFSGAPTNRVRTVAELLRTRSEDDPHRLAYSFLTDGQTSEERLSYAQLDRRARAVAAGLRDAGGVLGSRALLLLPPGLDYVAAFFGCLYAGVVAVPMYPPDPSQLERTLPRLLAIARDADAVVALTTSLLLGYAEELTHNAPELGGLRWLAVDRAPDAADIPDGPPAVDPDGTALLQYTSGSTATPRGVMLSHQNLLHNSGLIQRVFGTTSKSRALSWLPPYHDMGLIGGLIQPLYAGCPVTLMSPTHFLAEPLRWLRAISRLGVTISGGPNFAYDLCVRKTTPEQRAELDLSGWQVAFNGAEPIRPGTLRSFADAFAGCGFQEGAFRPCYGLAEATLMVSGTGAHPGATREGGYVVRVDPAPFGQHIAVPATGEPSVCLTRCGGGAEDQRIAIVDPATTTICEPGRVGEIWVSGPSIAMGYWGKPAETEAVFHARIADRADDATFLRTGDLGFLLDGDLVVTGRVKDTIIIRGRNHYPQDIELTAERAEPLLRPGCSAAFLIPDDGDGGGLTLVHEVRRDGGAVDVAAVAGRIRQAVATEHGLRIQTVSLLAAGGMPKTSSGKVQRWLCRAQFAAAQLPEIGRCDLPTGLAVDPAPLDAEQVAAVAADQRPALVESYLRGQLAVITGTAVHELDRDLPLLAAGLDSLGVVSLKQRVETDLAVSLPLAPVLSGASLSAVVDQLAGRFGEPTVRLGGPAVAAGAAASPVMSAADECVTPLWYNQRSLWFMQQLEPASSAYVITAAVRSRGSVDCAALRRALDTVVSRHPSLRTTFRVSHGELVQVVHPGGRAEYREHDVRDLDEPALTRLVTRAARQPINLAMGPLLRLGVYDHRDGHVLLLSIHHIVADFWSMTVLVRELEACYSAYVAGREVALPPVTATYLDVVAWERSILADRVETARLAKYWDAQVGSGLPPLALPAAGKSRSVRGGALSFSLAPALTQGLRERAVAEGVTLYVLLLATFQALLHHHTGQGDLVVGAPMAARRPEFTNVVGLCVNPVIIRSRGVAGTPFRALLHRARDQIIGALEHRDYPMDLLAERHRVARGGGVLFEAMFTFNQSTAHGGDLAALVTIGPPGVRRSLGPLILERFPLPLQESSLPVSLTMAEATDSVHGVLEYRADAFPKPVVGRLAKLLLAMLERVAADPDRTLGELAD